MKHRYLVGLLGLLILTVFVALDACLTGMVLVPLYGFAVLLVVFAGSPIQIGCVGVVATLAAAAMLAIEPGTLGLQDAIRLATVIGVSGLAVVFGILRRRLDRQVKLERDGRNRLATQVTMHEHARRELDEAYGLLEVIFAHAPIGVGMVDHENRYVRLNERLAAINGAPVEAHIGRRPTDILGKEFGSLAEELLTRTRDTGEPLVNFELQGPDVETAFLVSYWPIYHRDGIAGIGALVEDITERKQAERERERLLEDRSKLAFTLQEALLPPDLPSVPGLNIAARYMPARSGSEVGGDFYEWLRTKSGSLSLIIGDVQGKGPEAARITSLTRNTSRVAARISDSPNEVLQHVNRSLLEHSDERFVTMVAVVFDEIADDHVNATLAIAGHPHPLILRSNGETETIGESGPLLGIFDHVDLPTQQITMNRGDSLVLYTDGVTEADRHDQHPEETLSRRIQKCTGQSAQDIADKVVHCAYTQQDGNLRDDIAVLVAQAIEQQPSGPLLHEPDCQPIDSTDR